MSVDWVFGLNVHEALQVGREFSPSPVHSISASSPSLLPDHSGLGQGSENTSALWMVSLQHATVFCSELYGFIYTVIDVSRLFPSHLVYKKPIVFPEGSADL